MRCFFGIQGAGKTYCMVHEMNRFSRDSHAYRRIFVTNFESDYTDIRLSSPGDFFKFLHLCKIYKNTISDSSVEPIFMVYLDEVGSWFNNRDYKLFDTGMVKLVTQLRKAGVNFTYTVQHPDMVDITFRRNTLDFFHHTKFLAIGKLDRSMQRRPWGFRQTHVVLAQFVATDEGEEIPVQQKMLVNSKSVYLLRKKIASSYDSWEIDEAPMNTVHSDELNPSPEESQQFFDNVNDILEQKRLKGLRPPRIQFYIPSPFFYI